MKLALDIQEQFKSFANSRKKELDDELDLILQGLGLCDSPIEQMFLLGIVQHWFGTCPIREGEDLGFRSNLVNFISLEYVGDISVEIYPQREIEVGEEIFRVDFLFEITGNRFFPTDDGCLRVNRKSLRLIVEIDGHNFHERTKIQARRDKSRDRLLHKHGYMVIRYTGSEVFQDVYRVVRELAELILAKAFSVSQVYDLAYEL